MPYSLDQSTRREEVITYAKTGKSVYHREDVLRYYVSDEPVIGENSYNALSTREVYFLPDTATVKFDTDYADYVTVQGDLIKKDGTPGQRRPSRLWLLSKIEEAPMWVRELVRDAAGYVELS